MGLIISTADGKRIELSWTRRANMVKLRRSAVSTPCGIGG